MHPPRMLLLLLLCIPSCVGKKQVLLTLSGGWVPQTVAASGFLNGILNHAPSTSGTPEARMSAALSQLGVQTVSTNSASSLMTAASACCGYRGWLSFQELNAALDRISDNSPQFSQLSNRSTWAWKPWVNAYLEALGGSPASPSALGGWVQNFSWSVAASMQTSVAATSKPPAPLAQQSPYTPQSTLAANLAGAYTIDEQATVLVQGLATAAQFTPEINFDYIPGHITMPGPQPGGQLVFPSKNVTDVLHSRTSSYTPTIAAAFGEGAQGVLAAAACSGTFPGFVVGPDDPTKLTPLNVPLPGVHVAPGAPMLCGDGGFTDNTAITVALRNFQAANPEPEEEAVVLALVAHNVYSYNLSDVSGWAKVDPLLYIENRPTVYSTLTSLGGLFTQGHQAQIFEPDFYGALQEHFRFVHKTPDNKISYTIVHTNTVQNELFNISAGTAVSLVVVFDAIPVTSWVPASMGFGASYASPFSPSCSPNYLIGLASGAACKATVPPSTETSYGAYRELYNQTSAAVATILADIRVQRVLGLSTQEEGDSSNVSSTGWSLIIAGAVLLCCGVAACGFCSRFKVSVEPRQRASPVERQKDFPAELEYTLMPGDPEGTSAL